MTTAPGASGVRMTGLLFALLALPAGVAVLPASASAQVYGTDIQTVGVQVSPITVLSVQGGAVTLSLSDANVTAGVDEMVVQDQATRLLWGTNSSGRKITAQSSLATPQFTLRLAAVNPTRGTSAAEMALDATARDLLLNIGRSQGSCTLRYTGTALASQGAGTDVHSITFTVTTQ